jgi:DNA polymerase III gamma/tau subunit
VEKNIKFENTATIKIAEKSNGNMKYALSLLNKTLKFMKISNENFSEAFICKILNYIII